MAMMKRALAHGVIALEDYIVDPIAGGTHKVLEEARDIRMQRAVEDESISELRDKVSKGECSFADAAERLGAKQAKDLFSFLFGDKTPA